MSSDNLAAYYQSHKDDDSWGEAEKESSSPRRRLASMISVRFSPDEAEIVRAAAEKAGSSLSNFVREASLSAARGSSTVSVVKVVTAVSSAAAATLLTAVGDHFDLARASGEGTKAYLAGEVGELEFAS